MVGARACELVQCHKIPCWQFLAVESALLGAPEGNRQVPPLICHPLGNLGGFWVLRCKESYFTVHVDFDGKEPFPLLEEF